MRKTGFLLMLAILTLPLHAQDQPPAPVVKNKIILAPVASLTDNREFEYLKGTVHNVLLYSLKEQERIEVVNDDPAAAAVINAETDFESFLRSLSRAFPGSTAIIAEYYVAREQLHILVNVWELDTRRVKNSFIETMPADLDLLDRIKKMSTHIAVSVARSLEPTVREALFNQQVAASLRRKINDEDRFVEEIYSRHHEFWIVPFTGLGLGRTVVSWTVAGPLVSPMLALGYAYSFDDTFHLRASLEYLGFDVSTPFGTRQEATFEILFGLHEKSSFSFSADIGLAVIYDYNQASVALAYTSGTSPFFPSIERISLSLPISLGFSVHLSPLFFVRLGFKYHGLTYTCEPYGPESYDDGAVHYRYYYGFSPWSLSCMSILVQAGVRF